MEQNQFNFRRLNISEKITAPVATSSSPSPPWIELPADVTANILKRLGSIEVLESAQYVCTTWWTVCQDSSIWRVIDTTRPLRTNLPYLEKMCRHSVGLSKGELIDINISRFGTDELLHHISVTSSNLRRLTISWCLDISGKGLVEAVKNIPHLEDLHIMYIIPLQEKTIMYLSRPITGGDIETIGLSCPMLKSFKLSAFICHDQSRFVYVVEKNEYALAIAISMPNLRHLQLLDGKMTDEGLAAILDGCPHLESLDLQGCFGVDLRGEVGKKCSQKIKSLKRPHDYYESSEYSSEYSDVDSIDYYLG